MSNKSNNRNILLMVLGTLYFIGIIVCFVLAFLTESQIMVGVTIGLAILLFATISILYNFKIVKSYKEIDEIMSQVPEEMRIDVKTSIKYKKIYGIALILFIVGFFGIALSIIFQQNATVAFVFLVLSVIVAVASFFVLNRAGKKIKPVQYFISYLEETAVKVKQETERLEAEYAQLLQEQVNKEPTDNN